MATASKQRSRIPDDVYQIILERISGGELVTDVAKELGYCRTDVWRASENGTSDSNETPSAHSLLASHSAYMRARIAQAHSIAEDTILISDGRDADGEARTLALVESLDGVDEKDKQRLLNSLQSVAVQRDTLRVNTRKFLLAKIAPKIYGDHSTQEVTGSVVVEHNVAPALQASLAARLAGIASRRLPSASAVVVEDSIVVDDTATDL